MRLPRFRLRTLMIVVAIAGAMLGTVLGLQRRREHFKRIAEKYDWLPAPIFTNRPSDEELARTDRLAIWRIVMAEKYRYYASYPWLPVPPDPPEPK